MRKWVFSALVLLCFSRSWAQDLSNYVLLSKVKSIKGVHKLYEEQKDQSSVFNSILQVHQYGHDVITKRTVNKVNPDLDLFGELIEKVHEFKDVQRGYWLTESQYINVIKKQMWVNADYPYRVVFADERLLHISPLFYSAKDSIIKCDVFDPNPIVSSNMIYGDPIADNGDLSNSSFQQQMKRRSLAAYYDNGSFILQSDKVKLVDISLPNNKVPANSQDQFIYSRSQEEFESVNAFYHSSLFIKYVEDELGFNSLFAKQLQIDAHGLNGADNSIYVGLGALPQILFGDGGVDDAEDGQVIIHEMGHALTDAASPSSNFGVERNAIDEGIGDYLSASYSKFLYPDNSWENIPSWDGHNEFWDGRVVNAGKRYPENLLNNKYLDGEIWSSALISIENELGRDLTHTLLVESSFLYHQGMTFHEAAGYFLKADTLLNEGVNTEVIYDKFCDRGLVEECDSSSFMEGLVTVDFEELARGVLVFSKNILQFSELEMYDSGGKLVYEANGGLPEVVDVKWLGAGVYVIRFGDRSKFQVLKVVVW